MQILATEHGGKCISTSYKNTDTPLEWECAKGHRFYATPDKVKYRHQWCPTCAGRRKTIVDLRKWAAKRGGKCLSQEYKGIHEKYEWECADGHPFPARASDIKSGTWCPYCDQSVGESKCRHVIEQLFNTKFPKARPEILMINKTTRLEFDGYSKKLKIAFEYQGRQHYEFVDWIQSSEASLLKQQNYDRKKRELCRINGITLIEIPHTVPLDEQLVTFIKARCIECGLSFSDGKIILLSDASSFRKYHLNEMREIAAQKKGKCLSDSYVNAKTKMNFKCHNVHQFGATPDNIKSGKWCPYCAGKNKTIEDMKKIAKEKGGLCLSKHYRNNHTNLKWQCAKGDIWMATFSNVQKGTWCPFCAGKQKLTIDEMHRIAKERGGKCLSKEYVNNRTELLWECGEKHQWWAKPLKIKTGHWCPKCAVKKNADSQRGDIIEYQNIAKSRSGRCLSNKYVNSKTKLQFECKEGHKWWAIPSDIKIGKWCRKCAFKRNADRQRGDIVEYQNIAKSRGGECLSNQYVNCKTKMQFKCKESHKWWATPSHIKEGSWCPECAKFQRKSRRFHFS